MPLITGEKVGHAFGAEEVLGEVSFRVSESDRIGLVGPNGEGKTTLLRIIGGMLAPLRGEVRRRRGLSMGYLPQGTAAGASAEGGTVRGAMLDVCSEARRMERELETLAARIEERSEKKTLSRYEAMETAFEAAGGYGYRTRIEQVLTGLGFGQGTWERALSELSGGELTRVQLGRLLLAGPEVLLLDEPTNHLDIESVEWLERWLSLYRGAVVAVSHDRYFLDRVTKKTWEIGFGKLAHYRGSYSAYVKQREERRAEEERTWEAQQEHIAKTRDFIARNIAGQRTKEAQGRRTRLERFLRDEAVKRPQEHREMGLRLSVSKRTGDFVLRTEGLAIGYGEGQALLEGIDLEVMRGDRIAIVGGNGTGKTTLVRTLLGELSPLAGKVRVGANVEMGYLSQAHAELDPEQPALSAVMEAPGGGNAQRAREALGAVLLSGDDVLKRIGELSGGQRSRVVLARLAVQRANVLVLDEPTNHLDIPSTEILQEALATFEGTVIFASHDRYLVQGVAREIWVIAGGKLARISGGWEAYVQWREGQKGEDEGGSRRRERYRSTRRRANEQSRLRRRHEELEAEIHAVEGEIRTLSKGIAAASEAGELARIAELGKLYERREQHLARLWEEWEELGEKLEEG